MALNIDIPDRILSEIKYYCDNNNIKVDEYIVSCLSDHIYTIKYGDLNDKKAVKSEPINQYVVNTSHDRKEEMCNITNETDNKSVKPQIIRRKIKVKI